VLAFAHFVDIYSKKIQPHHKVVALRIINVAALSFATFCVLAMMNILTFHQLALVGAFLLTFGVLQFAWHISFRKLAFTSPLKTKVMVLGEGDLAQLVGKTVQKTTIPMTLVGYAGNGNQAVNADVKNKIACSSECIMEKAKELGVNKIVVALKDLKESILFDDLMRLKMSGVEIFDAPTFYEQTTGKLLLEHSTPGWFIFSNGFKVTSRVRIMKRVLDIIYATIGLVLTLPVFPVLALLIKLDSPGDVFFRQIRVGEDGKNFTIFKFRTMCNDAEAKTGCTWCTENDPRITRVGGFLRKTRLDEIPQLLNVLLGDMSLIGPRPERPEFVEDLNKKIPYYSNRHYVKPGLTGWAQIWYPYGSSVEDAYEKLRYDLYYIKHISLFLDVKIILKTIHVVLMRKGR
jgi:sugar transferase (PEP-CTERM system associated)